MWASWPWARKGASRRSLIPKPEPPGWGRAERACKQHASSIQLQSKGDVACTRSLRRQVFEYESCPDEEFAADLEAVMKAEEGGLSRFGALFGALTKLSDRYHMTMPGPKPMHGHSPSGPFLSPLRSLAYEEAPDAPTRLHHPFHPHLLDTGRDRRRGEAWPQESSSSAYEALQPLARKPDFNIYEASLPYAVQRALSPKTEVGFRV